MGLSYDLYAKKRIASAMFVSFVWDGWEETQQGDSVNGTWSVGW